MNLQEMLESLYGLDRWELRRLAAEALLISDGPASELLNEEPGNAISVWYRDVRPSHTFTIQINAETVQPTEQA